MDLTQLIGAPLNVAVISTFAVAVLTGTLPMFTCAHLERTGVEAGSAARYVAGNYAALLVYFVVLVGPWSALQATGILESVGLLAVAVAIVPALLTFGRKSSPRYGVAREAYLMFDATKSEYEDWTAAYAAGDLL